MNGMGGVFYQVAQPDVLIVDMGVQPTSHTQSDLRSEIGDFEDLMALDYSYCAHIEGVCQETNLWVARNQNKTGLADADLQRFKSVAWNECVVKKFLSTREGNADLVGKSMLGIIQSLNLQWGSLQVMGLHPKIEAAEKQVVMSCMEKGFIPYDLDVGKIARSLRRCEHFCDFFANAVGAQIVANTGRTPGLSKTMYGTDMDYAYRDKALYFFESSLQRFKHIVTQCLADSDSADYVARLAELKVIRQPAAVDLQKAQQDQGPREVTVQQQPFFQQPVVAAEPTSPNTRSNIGRIIHQNSDLEVLVGQNATQLEALDRSMRQMNGILTRLVDPDAINRLINRVEMLSESVGNMAKQIKAQSMDDDMDDSDVNMEGGASAEVSAKQVPAASKRSSFFVVPDKPAHDGEVDDAVLGDG